MASFLTNLGRKHKISKRWLLGMPTSVKVEGLSTLHRLQTCICSETTPQDFQSLTLSLPSPPKVRLQLQTVISQATGGFEPPDLFQWILHWNLHQNSQNSFFWQGIWVWWLWPAWVWGDRSCLVVINGTWLNKVKNWGFENLQKKGAAKGKKGF